MAEIIIPLSSIYKTQDMKRITLTTALSLLLCVVALAQAKPTLKYNEDGKFKIAQFTDLHHQYGKPESRRAIECLNSVLDSEKPDFVVITGDLIYANNVEKAMEEITEPMVSRGVPFCITFGNHDHGFDRSLSQIYDQVQAKPLAVMPDRGNSESYDYTVELRSKDDSRIANVFYCIYSHTKTRHKGVGVYDWIHPDQIMWYLDSSREYKEGNKGKPLPSLLFTHIPLMEYQYAESDDKIPLFGNNRERICCPALNSGLFTAFYDEGDVVGMFCGHDHDNDFATVYQGVLLAYGRYSGGDTEYNHLGQSGARMIELKEGSRDLRTWIRLADGTVEQEMSFPSDFKKKK